jgi:hypothetical protein
MPIMTKRIFPSPTQPVVTYDFELNKEETDRFFNEFLKDFFDQGQLGDLEVRDKKVTFSMNLFKKEKDTTDIAVE